MKRSYFAVLAVCLSVAGCASSDVERAERPSRQTTVLTQDELLTTQQTSVYDAVAALRPTWLQRRAPLSSASPGAGQVRVYIGSIDAGGAEYLRQLRVEDVRSLRFLSGTEAGQRFGLRTDGSPVILVNLATR